MGLLAREGGVDEEVAAEVEAILEDRGTTGGSTACLHIRTIRFPMAFT